MTGCGSPADDVAGPACTVTGSEVVRAESSAVGWLDAEWSSRVTRLGPIETGATPLIIRTTLDRDIEVAQLVKARPDDRVFCPSQSYEGTVQVRMSTEDGYLQETVREDFVTLDSDSLGMAVRLPKESLRGSIRLDERFESFDDPQLLITLVFVRSGITRGTVSLTSGQRTTNRSGSVEDAGLVVAGWPAD
jgi:hypothetical protein